MGITIHSEESKSGTTTQVNFNFTEQQSPPHYPSTADHMQPSRRESMATEHRESENNTYSEAGYGGGKQEPGFELKLTATKPLPR